MKNEYIQFSISFLKYSDWGLHSYMRELHHSATDTSGLHKRDPHVNAEIRF